MDEYREYHVERDSDSYYGVDFAIADNDKSVIESKEKQGSRGT